MSMSDGKQKILDNIIRELQEAKYNDVAPILLRAKAVLQPPDEVRQRNEAELEREKRGGKRLIWQSGLITHLSNALYRDYLKVDNDWLCAAEIGQLTVTCCTTSGDLTPNPEFRSEILQKTADGLWQLLSHVHEYVDWGIDEASIRRANASFQKICTSCYQFYVELPDYASRAWQSTNLMPILEDKTPRSVHWCIWDLCMKMAKLNQSAVCDLPAGRRCRIMDAAADALRRTDDPKLANTSVQFLTAWMDAYPLMLTTFIVRHDEIKGEIAKWRGHGFDTAINSLTTYMSTGSVADRDSQKLHESAARIQAFYRGCLVRRRLAKIKSGFVQLQQLFRVRRKKLSEGRLTGDKDGQEILYLDRLNHYQNDRRYLEKKLRSVSCIHASLVEQYLESEADHAATVIQALWRGYATRKKYDQISHQHKLDTAARTIQIHMRQWYQRRRRIKERLRHWPGLTESRREELQLKIDRYQERHKVDHSRSKQAQKELHDTAQSLLIDHYNRYYGNLNAYQRREATLARIRMNIQTLESAPKLTEATCQDLVTFNVHNRAIALRATHGHNEELRFHRLPKWQQLLERAEHDMEKWTRQNQGLGS